jgi:hypothetical protein
MTEKELERTMKWRDMAIIDRPSGSIHYRFPLTKKVIFLRECIDSSWCNGRSREFLTVGERLSGMNSLIVKPQNAEIANQSTIS